MYNDNLAIKKKNLVTLCQFKATCTLFAASSKAIAD